MVLLVCLRSRRTLSQVGRSRAIFFGGFPRRRIFCNGLWLGNFRTWRHGQQLLLWRSNQVIFAFLKRPKEMFKSLKIFLMFFAKKHGQYFLRLEERNTILYWNFLICFRWNTPNIYLLKRNLPNNMCQEYTVACICTSTTLVQLTWFESFSILRTTVFLAFLGAWDLGADLLLNWDESFLENFPHSARRIFVASSRNCLLKTQ